MLQLLNPIWLFGIAGILVPLIIHLWNVKTGKTLKVGSIMLMGESSRQNSRSLKLMDLLLLFLRCLLIIVLSLILAEPVWRSLSKQQESKAWILLEKDAFPETYNTFKNQIDSLIKAGNELRLFEPGFVRADVEELKSDTGSVKSPGKLPYWSLLKLMQQQIPNGVNAYIFTGDKLSRFQGERPAINTAVTWKTYTSSDSSAKWIEHAYFTPTGDVQAIVSESSPRGTLTKTVSLSPGTSIGDIKSTIAGGQAQVQLNDQTIPADTSTLKIAINSDGFAHDGEYLVAALQAIQKYTSRKIRFVKPSSKPDILFWLTAKDLPADIEGTVFRYVAGKTNVIDTWITSTESGALQKENIALHKRIVYPEDKAAFSIWKDGFGKPVLDLTQKNNAALYSFYSRLDPEWTDLVWSPQFVKLLLPIIIPGADPLQNNSLDKRSIARSQITPLSDLLARRSFSEGGPVNNTDLTLYFWSFLIALLLLERFLSFRNNPN
ncbi:BatA domain-containing protein [Daejeonella lutea]|uniref:N-terminal double-transmembrane domain-containing protein n=1 Tax=Daejeonella lutea TaxID=572036 RepID=A0A1T5ETT7_9SPHI|nr:BatA domain-containing protein [Daejeonella lutea]SKB87268.1 N-terminal double-transmembrane domain-containing protein [Daejeonella lutea]